MRDSKRKRLEVKGWRVGDARAFLGLSGPEAEFVELKLRLARTLREKRLARGLGQVALAKLLHSGQSRVAKMEAADASVSLDLLIRSLQALGTSNPELGRIISHPR